MIVDIPSPDDFVALLESSDVLSAPDAARLRALRSTSTEPFDVIVVELGILRDVALAEMLGRHLDLEHVEKPEPCEDLARTIGLGYLIRRGALPLPCRDGEPIELVVADPFDDETRTAVAYCLEAEVRLLVSTREAIAAGLAGIVPETDEIAGAAESEADATDDLDRLRDIAREEPVVRFVSRMIQTAVTTGATDIHIEPMEHQIRVRMRRDGMLHVVEHAAKALHGGIVTRIKILARLNISERRLPQDGRLRFVVRGEELDLRVSVMPTIHGETIVLRVLDRSNVALDLPSLGFGPDEVNHVESLARLPNGIVLVTGPTGSGKTTTLYAMLSLVNRPEAKVFTVEDPVEYRLDGATQLQVDPEIGLTFAAALRSVLRQDPDIVLVGEIRDRETAEIAMQAALTGHLVLSTLHTNTALGAVTRLRDLGLDDFLLGATLKGLVGQRLVRTLCQSCHGDGCDACSGSGYRGRTVVSETATAGAELSAAIASGRDEAALGLVAAGDGFRTMKEGAQGLVDVGVTSRAELARVLGAA